MKALGATDKAAKLMFISAASTSILIVVLIFLFIGKEAAPFFQREGIAELFGTVWMPTSPKEEQFGIIPLFVGSVLVTALAIVLSIPFGVVGAVYLAELARPLEREIIKPFIELLAGIPSVVLGFFGMIIVGPFVKDIFNLSSGQSALTGALLLALMAVPTILTISEDAIRNVPQSYKSASLALGATRMQTIWKVSVPAALSGIVAAVMLGIGRVIGETMTVLMVTGGAAVITLNPTRQVRTMTATIANETGEVVHGSTHYAALFCIGIVLLLLTFALNLAAQRVLKRYGLGRA